VITSPMTRILALAALLAVVAPMHAAERGNDHPIRLAEAIERALARNDAIVIERTFAASADAAVEGAQGAYDPILEVTGGWRRETPPVNSAFAGAPDGELSPTTERLEGGAAIRRLLPTGGEVAIRALAARETTNGAFALLSPAYGTSVGVELRQPLLRGRAIDGARLRLRVAASEREQAEALLRREVAETVSAVERAYWTLYAAREQVGVREDAIRLAEEQLQETRLRIESGISPDTEIAQPRAELERRRGEFYAALEAVSRSENALRLLILGEEDGELWSQTLAPVEEGNVEAVPVDVAAALDRALALRPELEASSAAERRRAAEAQFARNETRPALDAVASYDRFGLSGSLNPAGEPIPGLPSAVPDRLEGGLGRSYRVLGDGDFDDARIGLVLTVPIGNRSARASAEAARQAELRSAAETARARKAIRAEVLDAAAALQTAYQRVEAARAEADAAGIQLDAERERFAAGLSTNFLVLTRQNDLERARLEEIRARTDFRIARTEMARSTGTLLEDRGIDWEASWPSE
jgi:outer membrane protein TolC